MSATKQSNDYYNGMVIPFMNLFLYTKRALSKFKRILFKNPKSTKTLHPHIGTNLSLPPQSLYIIHALHPKCYTILFIHISL